MNVRRATLTVLTALSLAATTAVPAQAQAQAGTHDDPAKKRADAYAARHPGGERLDDTTLSYDQGRVLIGFSTSWGWGTEADCKPGAYCLDAADDNIQVRMRSNVHWCQGAKGPLDLAAYELANRELNVANPTGVALVFQNAGHHPTKVVEPRSLGRVAGKGTRLLCTR